MSKVANRQKNEKKAVRISLSFEDPAEMGNLREASRKNGTIMEMAGKLVDMNLPFFLNPSPNPVISSLHNRPVTSGPSPLGVCNQKKKLNILSLPQKKTGQPPEASPDGHDLLWQLFVLIERHRWPQAPPGGCDLAPLSVLLLSGATSPSRFKHTFQRVVCVVCVRVL